MKHWIPGKVKLGCDELRRRIKGKQIALMLNTSAIDNEGRLLVDTIVEEKWAEVRFFFGMEHGVRGDKYAGDTEIDNIDKKTGLSIINLFERPDACPTIEEVQSVDAVVFCAQDVGVRHWTYTPWAMKLLKVCAQAGREVIILDRPNPIRGDIVEGGCAEPFSYGLLAGFDYPLRHGMTVGELALMYNEEKEIGAQLTVIPMTGWDRTMFFEETGLVWLPPSPNIPTVETILHFATTGLMQSANFSWGRGTTTPFQYIGDPCFDGDAIARELNSLNIPGVFFIPKYYRAEIFVNGAFEFALCNGIMTVIRDREIYRPVTAQIYMMDTICKMYPDYVDLDAHRVTCRNRMGTNKICDMAINHESLLPFIEDWQAQAEAFEKRRKPWLLY